MAPPPKLDRGLGLWQATAVNITQIVGAGVFATIPLILGVLPGPYALLAWLVAVLAVIGWVLVEGAIRFDPNVAFDTSMTAEERPNNFGLSLGSAMSLAIFSYLGYYNVCYLGAEVRDPARTIPRSILLSAV